MAEHRASIDLFLLSNLCPTETGVAGAVIWVSCGEFASGDPEQGPRLIAVLGERIRTEGLKDATTVRLTDPPEVLGALPGEIERAVVKFAEMNRGTLLRYWDGQLSTRELLDLMKRV